MVKAFGKKQTFSKSSIVFILVAFFIFTPPLVTAQEKKDKTISTPQINNQLNETVDQPTEIKKVNPKEKHGPSAIKILDNGILQFETIEALFIKKNPAYPLCRLQKIYDIYLNEALSEKINHDIAIAQMLHETGFLHFKGDVNPNQFNFAGIGAVGQGKRGEIFPSLKIGIRAQIQHLKAYASNKPLTNEIVDPRYHLVRKGSATSLSDLTGKWAADPIYAESIARIINQLKQIQTERESQIKENPTL